MERNSLGKDQIWRKNKSESQKIVGLESLIWRKKSAKVIFVNKFDMSLQWDTIAKMGERHVRKY